MPTSDLKAPAKFGDLSHAEKRLLKSVSNGEWAKCGPKYGDPDLSKDPENSPTIEDDDDPNNDPRLADKWGPTRRIRAELVSWVCMDPDARKHVYWRGIQVHGADITGLLDLSSVTFPFPLAFRHCYLADGINLQQAEVSVLSLSGSLVRKLMADGVVVKNSVYLDKRFASSGEVRLLNAQIGNALSCMGGTFTNPAKKGISETGIALQADGINVKSWVFLSHGFVASGEVRFPAARIGGLDCSGGIFTNPLQKDIAANKTGTALRATQITVDHAVQLRSGFKAQGEVNLQEAKIGGRFSCIEGNFREATLDLTNAAADDLEDSGRNDVHPSSSAASGPTIWPPQDKLLLDGFVYGRISSLGTINVDKRLEWLGWQPKMPVATRSYLQLGRVLREAGDDDGAKRVFMKMEQLRRSGEEHSSIAEAESSALKWSIGYGYHPMWAFWEIVGLSTLGWIPLP